MDMCQGNDLGDWRGICIKMVMLNFRSLTQFSVRGSRGAVYVRALALAIIVFGVAAVPTLSASASPITLGTASSYATLIGNGDTMTFGTGFNITGNVGFGTSDIVNVNGNGAITGNIYKANNYTKNGSGTETVSGTVYTQSMTQALSDATTASTAAAALTATSGLTDQGGSISLSSSSVTIKALTNLSENVLDISALSLSNSTLTFDDNGYTGAKFIINVTGGFSVTGSSIIKGVNGASGSDIIFNIEGTGSTVSLTGNSSSSVIGTILAPQRNVNLSGGGTLTGALIAGVSSTGGPYTVQSQAGGYNITSLGYVPRVSTPEPSSIGIFGAGVSVLLGLRRRLRKASR